SFELVEEREMTYCQPHPLESGGWLHLFTRYTAGRELYWERLNPGGDRIGGQHKLAAMGGHYQVSARHDGTLGTCFMHHPDGDVDRRTNLYYAQTTDLGANWTTAGGQPLDLPLADTRGPALVTDYQSQGLNVYIHDLNFDDRGSP